MLKILLVRVIATAFLTDIVDDGSERNYVMYFNIYSDFHKTVNFLLFFVCIVISTFAHILVFVLRYRRDVGFM